MKTAFRSVYSDVVTTTAFLVLAAVFANQFSPIVFTIISNKSTGSPAKQLLSSLF